MPKILYPPTSETQARRCSAPMKGLGNIPRGSVKTGEGRSFSGTPRKQGWASPHSPCDSCFKTTPRVAELRQKSSCLLLQQQKEHDLERGNTSVRHTTVTQTLSSHKFHSQSPHRRKDWGKQLEAALPPDSKQPDRAFCSHLTARVPTAGCIGGHEARERHTLHRLFCEPAENRTVDFSISRREVTRLERHRSSLVPARSL